MKRTGPGVAMHIRRRGGACCSSIARGRRRLHVREPSIRAASTASRRQPLAGHCTLIHKHREIKRDVRGILHVFLFVLVSLLPRVSGTHTNTRLGERLNYFLVGTRYNSPRILLKKKIFVHSEVSVSRTRSCQVLILVSPDWN